MNELPMLPQRAAVVGCGMGGPAVAALLARAGWAVTVLERAPVLGPVGAGILLQPTGLSVLARLGLLEAARTLGRPVRRLDARTEHGRPVWELRYADVPGLAGGGLGIHRGTLFTLLHEAARSAGARIMAGCEVVAVENRADDLAEIRTGGDGRFGPFDLVILAGGGRQEVVVPAAPSRRLRQYRWGAWWACLPDEPGLFPDTLAQVYRGTTGLLGFLPTGWLPDKVESAPLVSLFWSTRLDRAEHDRAAGITACRAAMLRLAPHAEPILRHLHDFSQLTLAAYGETRMPRWSTGRVVWLGDAAHAMSPHLGQGTNLAFLDAAALADCLAAEPTLPQALAEFERRRRAHIRTYQTISRWMMPFFQNSFEPLGRLRDIGMPLLCRIPWVRHQMIEVLAGLRGSLWRRARIKL
jgi:2-polyprenyl-6-methoxyphenol hydroxylase-like FAD-dependent oxidoreductase